MRRLTYSLAPLALLLATTGAAAQPIAAELRPKLETLAESGNAEAAYHLGMMHLRGIAGAEKDPKKAFELFTKAAEGGDPLGAYKLGCFYDGEGEGVAADDAELALKHKLVAAQAGYSLAQHDVAKFFYNKDAADEAAEWLLASAKQGYLPSLEALSSLYSGEGKLKRDLGKSLAYFMLLQASSKKKPSERAQAWLKETRAKLTPAEAAAAEDILKGWKVKPSPLTIQALAGQATAKKLVERSAAETPTEPAPAAQEAKKEPAE